MEDAADIRKDIDAVNEKNQALRRKWDDHQEKQRDCVRRGAEFKAEIANAHAECVPTLLDLDLTDTDLDG
jgi:hypothetical protein